MKLWQSNPQYRGKGIIFKNETNENDETYAKVFYTTEGNTTLSLSVTYNYRTYTTTAMKNYGLPTKEVTIRLLDTAQNATWRPIIESACHAWNNSIGQHLFLQPQKMNCIGLQFLLNLAVTKATSVWQIIYIWANTIYGSKY